MASIDTTTGQVVTPPVPTLVAPPAPTAATVYSAPNIVQAATAPVAAVNPALEDYNAYMNTPEMIAARDNVSTLQQSINAEKSGLRNTTTGLEYQNDSALGTTGASTNLIGRQVGRASELSTNRQAALGEQYQAALAYQQGLEATAKDKYNIIQAEKSKIQSLIAQTGNQAGIKVTDSFETATEKAFNWEKEQKKAAEKKSKDKTDDERAKELKKLISQMGGSTKTKNGGTMKLKELESAYEKLSGEKYKKTESRSDQEWAMKVAQYNKSMAGGTNTEFYKTANALKSQGKDWGYISGELGKKYDLTPGSAYSKQLDAIMTGKSGQAASGEVAKIMNALGVDAETAQKLILEEMKTGSE